MKDIRIELIPARNGIRANTVSRLDILVRITPPEAELARDRPPLNIGLVIDRSGSMGGDKIVYAKKAANFVVDQLLPTDRVSLVTYDNNVVTMVQNISAEDKNALRRKIDDIEAVGSTALHAGWLQGSIEVSKTLNPKSLNRVILLSDGLANVGETSIDVIASDVKGLAERGVSTSTVGVGRDYDEDFMSAVADSGAGNYWFIQSPEQLPAMFDQELEGILRIFGQSVSFSVTPSASVRLVDIMNDFKKIDSEKWRLPDLLTGKSIDIVLRFEVDAGSGPTPIFSGALSYDETESGRRKEVTSEFMLQALSEEELRREPENDEVTLQVLLFKAARAKETANLLVDAGDIQKARKTIKEMREELRPYETNLQGKTEIAALDELEEQLVYNDPVVYKKMAHFQMRGKKLGHGHHELFFKLCGGPVKGDITEPLTALGFPVGAIVNSTDVLLSQVGELSKAIHRAAGPDLARECTRIGRCGIGKAVVTKGYRLPAKWVIHTVCLPFTPAEIHAVDILHSCFESCIQAARERGIRTIAFPAVGIGAMNFPPEVAANTAMRSMLSLLSRYREIEAVLFVCNSDTIKTHYDKAFFNVTGRPPKPLT